MSDLAADEEIIDERVFINMKIDRELWFDYDEILRQGLMKVRATLKGLRELEKGLPQYPKPGEEYEEPLLNGIPVSRDAIYQMVMHYQKLEKNAVALLRVYDEGKRR
jgi:hypothetical protein